MSHDHDHDHDHDHAHDKSAHDNADDHGDVGDHGAHDHGTHAHHHHAPPPGATTLVACPVMPGNQVDPAWAEQRGLFRDYRGTRYWLCCAECGRLFDAAPARYAKAD